MHYTHWSMWSCESAPFTSFFAAADIARECPGHLKFSIIAAQWIFKILSTSTVSLGTNIFITSDSSITDSIWGLPGTQSVSYERFSGLSWMIQSPNPFFSGVKFPSGSNGQACKLFVVESHLYTSWVSNKLFTISKN